MTAPLLLAFALSLVICRVLAVMAPRLGLMDDPNQPRKSHPRPIPLVGGLGVWIAFSLTALFFCNPFPLPLWLATTGMALVGLVDDLVELSAFPKLILQVAIALGLWFLGTRVTLFINSPASSIFFTVIWFVGIANAFNYIDNCNGYCAGVGAIILGGLATLHLLFPATGAPALTVGTLALVGALTGFLAWNFPGGRLFLGDSGSHLVGAAVATLMIQTTFVHTSNGESPMAFMGVALFVSIPIFDFIQVTLGRLRRGQAIWKGDAYHLSHLLMRGGLSLTTAVLLLWGLTATSMAAGILLWRRLL